MACGRSPAHTSQGTKGSLGQLRFLSNQSLMPSFNTLRTRLWHFVGTRLPRQKALERQRQRDWTGLRSSPFESLPCNSVPLGMLGKQTASHNGTESIAASGTEWAVGSYRSLSPSIHLCSLSCENLLSVKLVESWFWGWTICLVPNGIHELGEICMNCSLQQEEFIHSTAPRFYTFSGPQPAWRVSDLSISGAAPFILFCFLLSKFIAFDLNIISSKSIVPRSSWSSPSYFKSKAFFLWGPCCSTFVFYIGRHENKSKWHAILSICKERKPN